MRALGKRMRELMKELMSLSEAERAKKGEEIYKECMECEERLSELRRKVERKSFRARKNPLAPYCEEIFFIEPDLRDFKGDLKRWDIVPIVGRAYFKHRGESVVLEDEFFVKYTGFWRNRVDKKFLKRKVLTLFDSYPNPFSVDNYIPYGIPKGRRGKVKLRIYNILGQLVKEIELKAQKPGYYTIKGRAGYCLGRELPAGLYYYQLVMGKEKRVKKGLVLR